MSTALHVEPLALPLRSPFRIAHGTSRERTNALMRWGDALGEGALPPYYPHDYDDVERYVRRLNKTGALDDTDALHLDDALGRLPPGPAPARCAVDLALHDRWGRALGQPLYRLWGLNPNDAPASAVTLSLPDNPDAFREQVRDLREQPILKLKLGGTDNDPAIVEAAREESDAEIGVDVNGGWSVERATRLIPRIAECDLAYVEQPIASKDAADWKRLREELPLDAPPLVADESVQDASDVLRLAEAVDGVNVKLAKAGGLRGTRRLITLARALGLSVLLGCMIESSIALTAAAHLAPLADHLDLDAQWHLASDPFRGVAVERGRLHLPDAPGLGVRPA